MCASPKARIRWHRDAVQQEVAAVEQELAGRGRVLLRKSGTEPLIRVMVEGNTSNRCVTWQHASHNGRIGVLMNNRGGF